MTTSARATSIIQEAAVGGAKAAPGGVLAAWHWIAGFPVETWVSIAVLVFTVLQIVVIVRDKFIRDPGRANGGAVSK